VTAFVIALVAVGVIAVGAAALAGGTDAVGLTLLGAIAAVGAMGVAAARRAARGSIAPARCRECEGLVSPHAPYCKHCGAPRPGAAS
jgi:hypothetical protein